MKILILQHEIETPAGTTLQWLAQNKISYEIFPTDGGRPWPSLDSFDGLLICGGSMNVDQEALLPWLREEKNFIAAAVRAGKKTLGLCLGGQLLAEVLGGSVGPLHHWEAGWFDVQWSGENDGSAASSIPAFHWHQYGFKTPPEARRIASNENTTDQAFAFKDHVLAFQFHPEVNAEWIRLTLVDYQDNISGHYRGAVQNEATIHQKSEKFLDATRDWYFAILDKHFLN